MREEREQGWEMGNFEVFKCRGKDDVENERKKGTIVSLIHSLALLHQYRCTYKHTVIPRIHTYMCTHSWLTLMAHSRTVKTCLFCIVTVSSMV